VATTPGGGAAAAGAAGAVVGAVVAAGVGEAVGEAVGGAVGPGVAMAAATCAAWANGITNTVSTSRASGPGGAATSRVAAGSAATAMDTPRMRHNPCSTGAGQPRTCGQGAKRWT
jgi:hypothetical protein